MSDKRCETCKWWDSGSQFTAWINEREPERWGICSYHYLRPTHMVIVGPYEQDHMLATRYDYGCTQWEAREQEGT